MAIVSVSEAARLVGKTRKTIQRHISIGKLSKVTGATGIQGIDTSELIRVYGEINQQGNSHEKKWNNTHNVSHNVADVSGDNSALKKEIELLRELLTSKDAHIESLNKAMLLLEYKSPLELQAKNKDKKPWWKIFSSS